MDSLKCSEIKSPTFLTLLKRLSVLESYSFMDNCGTCSTQKSSYPDRELHTKRAITYAVLCNFSK